MTEPFRGTSGPRDARIAIVGEAWGKEEVAQGLPFVGESGKLLTKLLGKAGIDRNHCFLTNITPRQAPYGEFANFFIPNKEAKKAQALRGLYPKEEIRADLSRLHTELATVQPTVIVALGNYPLWALTASSYRIKSDKGIKRPTGITSWRGSQLAYDAPERDTSLPPVALVPTIHPAAVMRQWPLRVDVEHDFRVRVKPIAEGAMLAPNNRHFILRPTFEETLHALDTIQALPSGSYVTFDIEGAVKHMDCIGLAWSKSDAICIPFFSIFSAEPYWTLVEEQVIRRRLQRVFARRDLCWCAQNCLFDLQYMARDLLDPPIPHCDPMVAQHVLYPGTPKDLTQLASLYCEEWRYYGEAKDQKSDEERWLYNCWDCAYTWEICFGVTHALIATGLLHLFHERMQILYEVAFPMILKGVRIDVKERMRQCFGDINTGTGGVVNAIAERESYLHKIMPSWIPPLLRGKTATSDWTSSPQQQAVFFYDFCGAKEIRDRKTKARTCDDDALEKIKLEKPILAPIIETLQEMRSLGKLYAFLTAKLSPDGRIRSGFNVAGPVSFRWSSGEDAFGDGANIQNVFKEKSE